MRIGEVHARNFGSYKELVFNYADQSLVLVSGATGAGKSTLQDMVCWCLYGITAKAISADSIQSWGAECGTSVSAAVQLGDAQIRVCRMRSPNDLFWTEQGSNDKIRGKDLKDTQRLLEERLQVSAEDYIAAAYFHEFSPSGSFFQAKAKERRELFERLADLSLATTLGDTCRNRASELRKVAEKTERDLAGLRGRFEQLERSARDAVERSKEWEESRRRRIKSLEAEVSTFEELRDQNVQEAERKKNLWEEQRAETLQTYRQDVAYLEGFLLKGEALPDVIQFVEEKLAKATEERCPACGGPKESAEAEEHRKTLERLNLDLSDYYHNKQKHRDAMRSLEKCQAMVNPHQQAPEWAKQAPNKFALELDTVRNQTNPYTALIAKNIEDIKVTENEIQELEATLINLNSDLGSLETLQDISITLRTVLLENAVQRLQDDTNECLENYFDAELRVTFTPGNDKLDVQIYKDGHEASFTQLSKGQRQLLKLCFAISVMRASANRYGKHYDNLFFDEALDGLDTELKLKAFRLFESLAKDHGTVLVIDHSPDLQQLFNKRYRVELVDGASIIHEES